jgi:hypothetical protein
MSQEHLELAHELVDVVARRDVPRLLELADPDKMVLLVGQLRWRGKESGVETASPAGWLVEFSKRTGRSHARAA